MFIHRACLYGLVSISSTLANAETVTTAEILSRTLQAVNSCLDWKWIGNCFWLDCNLLDCRVKTSIKVRHYRPDLLVTVQNSPANIPWKEMRLVLEQPQMLALTTIISALSGGSVKSGGGHVAVVHQADRNRRLRFYEANVFGHPIETIPSVVSRLFCKPRTTKAKPYFQSVLDSISWRFSPVESLS